MPLEYNKVTRVRKSGKSPRDLQNKGARLDNDYMLELLTKVTTLTSELENLKQSGVNIPTATDVSGERLYTETEFNTEIIKALEKELANTDKQVVVDDGTISKQQKIIEELKSKNTMLSNEVAHLNIQLEAKIEVIEALKSKPIIINSGSNVEGRTVDTSIQDPSQVFDNNVDRPKMDNSIIDPSDDGVIRESHINIDKVKQSDSMNDKLGKLKALLGG